MRPNVADKFVRPGESKSPVRLAVARSEEILCPIVENGNRYRYGVLKGIKNEIVRVSPSFRLRPIGHDKFGRPGESKSPVRLAVARSEEILCPIVANGNRSRYGVLKGIKNE